ncbi:MAG: quinolinate synthase NadA [Candidatus Bathyarchaeota archaeon]|nr:MAG: quinolinate synthase NadA [Candidatus Bathyarchaeota archaeon]
MVSTKQQTHPDVPVVLYANTLAEAEAECDVARTSANAALETTARKACRSRERMFSLTAG